MAVFQLDVLTRNAMLDAMETSIGTGPTLKIRTGALPANCAASDSGTVLATMALPNDWAADASGGSKSLLGTWQDLLGDADGEAGHFRIYDSGGTCRAQGDCTNTSGNGAMKLDNVNIGTGQKVTVNALTINAGNA